MIPIVCPEITADAATLLPLGGQAAIDALEAGQADAIFLVFAPESPLIQRLLRSDKVKLMNFTHADAYTRQFAYLSRLVLPQGSVALARNIPASDIALIAPTAALAVRDDDVFHLLLDIEVLLGLMSALPPGADGIT